MTGMPNYNYDAFDDAAQYLRDLGYFVFNPAETFGGDTTRERHHYMREDIQALLHADAVVLLPGWEGSSGVAVELVVANELQMPIYELHDLFTPLTLDTFARVAA
jgi:hypothetical protein